MVSFKKSRIALRCFVFLSLVTQTIFSHQIFCQNTTPYTWKKGADIGIFAGGISTYGAGLMLERKYRIDVNVLQNLKKSDIRPAFDRSAADNWSAKHNRNSNILLLTAYATPGLLLLSKDVRQNDFLLTVAMGAEVAAVTAGLTELTKNLVRRSRPYVYNPDVPLSEKTKKKSFESFFSGHTSSSASMCFYSAKVFSDFYPNSRWKPLVWGTAATLPLLVGYERYKAGKHFPTDVIVGYLVGGAVGFLVPHLHRSRH